MSETQQADKVYHGREQFEDEIELMDYLRVMWKWKYLIVAGTLICAVAAWVISFSMPKVYRIDMLVQPGILSMGVDGKNVYIDSAENIKAVIETEIFEQEIFEHVKESNNSSTNSIKLKVNLPKGADTLRVSYETPDVDQGSQILACIGQALSRNYGERVAYIQNEYETQIDLKRAEIAECEAKKEASEQHIKNLQKRIDELTPQIDLVRKNTTLLIQERDRFLSSNRNDSSVLSPVLYMDMTQHNISLENSYRQEMYNYVTRKEDVKSELKKLDRQLNQLLGEIKGLEFKKNGVQTVEILQPPTVIPRSIKPKKSLIVVLGAVLGLFLMLFLAFFLEYIFRYKKERGEI